MLILVFGIWLNANQITYMEDSRQTCVVRFGNNRSEDFEHSCADVAGEIKKQLGER